MGTRFSRLATAIAAVSFLASCQDSPTAATAPDSPPLNKTPASSMPFAGFMYNCSGTESDLWVTPGGVAHFEGATNTNEWVTGNSLIDGIEENLELGGIANPNGTVTVLWEATITPDAVNGTWETSTYHLTLNANGARGAKGVAHGTGDLAGMTIRFTIVPDFTMQPPETACNPDFPFVFVLEGVIHAAAS